MSESELIVKCSLMIFMSCLTVSSIQLQYTGLRNYKNGYNYQNNYNPNHENNYNRNYDSNYNAFRNDESPEDDRWIWGYVNDSQSDVNDSQFNKNNSQSSKILTPSYNDSRIRDEIDSLCSPYNPPMPNFATKGERISEIKCLEYIWKLKVRLDTKRREKKCAELQQQLDFNYNLNIMVGAIGGRNTVMGEFPHMGAIGWKAVVGTWIFKCGSSLISSKFVLTAAHCSRASDRDTTIADPVPKIIRLGDKNIIDVYANGVAPTDAKIIKIIVHPEFSPPKKYYDIALMELENDVVFSNLVQPACLWPKYDTSELGTQATLTGWGVVESNGMTISPELQAAVVDIIDNLTCDRLLKQSYNRNWWGMHNNQLCAGKLAGGVDACQGDSGGPLQVEIPLHVASEGHMHYIIGVTSFGIGCALPNLPGMYSRVSQYLDWIERIVWKR